MRNLSVSYTLIGDYHMHGIGRSNKNDGYSSKKNILAHMKNVQIKKIYYKCIRLGLTWEE